MGGLQAASINLCWPLRFFLDQQYARFYSLQQRSVRFDRCLGVNPTSSCGSDVVRTSSRQRSSQLPEILKRKPPWREGSRLVSNSSVRLRESPSPGELTAFELFMFDSQSSSHYFDVPWNSSPVKPVHPVDFTGQVLPSGVNIGFTSEK